MASPDLPEKIRRAREAAFEFLPLLKATLRTPEGSLHAGTLLSAAGWLTGTSLYRSFHFEDDSPPGTTIRSADVNREWESLMYLLEQYNLQKTDIPVGRLILAAMALPDSFQPEVEMLQVQRELQGSYNAVMKKHGFDYLDGARVGIVLCSILIQEYHSQGILDLQAATGIVAERVIEAAKTVPPLLEG